MQRPRLTDFADLLCEADVIAIIAAMVCVAGRIILHLIHVVRALNRLRPLPLVAARGRVDLAP